MERLFFVTYGYSGAGRVSAMERTMFDEACAQYLHHIVKEGDLDDIVLELQERQNVYCKGKSRCNPVPISHSLSPGPRGWRYINIGRSSLTLVAVQGEIPKC